MKIIKDKEFLRKLQNILAYIAQDKPTVARKFAKEFNEKITLLKENPYMGRVSRYYDDVAYRDLIFKGFTITYRVTEDAILILDIFKWSER